MVGWDVSRHPEWDMMYEAGLTIREISNWCHQNYSTVHLHLQVREKYSPGLRERHEKALDERGPNLPTTKWRNRLTEAVNFYRQNSRLPTASQEPVEQALFIWVCHQRRLFERGEMPLSKRVLLEELPGWDQNARQLQLDQMWISRLHEFQDFIYAYGRMPRYRNHSSELERRLGVWIHNQLQRKSQGNLADWRIEALDKVESGWKSRM